jgi:hypothetical protein
MKPGKASDVGETAAATFADGPRVGSELIGLHAERARNLRRAAMQAALLAALCDAARLAHRALRGGLWRQAKPRRRRTATT